MAVTGGVFGVIGHVDHGKTALVRALTGMETDRLPEEKRRGISIALGFAHLAVEPGRAIDLVDMPGHERFVRTMVSGATGIDGALLAVAANEGIKPQTVEHVEIAGLLGLRRAVVAITKSDLATAEAIRSVGAEIGALLRGCGLAAPPPIAVSVLDGTGLDALRAALAAAEAPPRTEDGLLYLPIDRAFTVSGHGTVVTGTLRGAAAAAGDELALWPGERRVRVRAVQVRGRLVARAAPGQRVAFNLRDVGLDEVAPGAVLSAPHSLTASNWVSVTLRALDHAPPLANAARLRALLGTGEVDVRLRLLDRDLLEPGDCCEAQLHCAAAVCVPVREPVILRRASPARTVAGGCVIEAAPGRRRRHDAAISAGLRSLAASSAPEIVRAEVERAGRAGTTMRQLTQLVARPASWVAAVLAEREIVIGRNGLVVTRAALAATMQRVQRLLGAEDGPIAREQLLARLDGVGRAVLDEALSGLIAQRSVEDGRGGVALRRPERERSRAALEAALRDEVAETLRRGGLTPPDAAAFADHAERRLVLERLVREGVVVRAPDPAQRRVVFFHQEAVDAARRRLRSLLSEPPGLLVSEVGAALGISRKYSVPLLEHLDQVRFTRRVQDRRILAAPAEGEAKLRSK